MMKSRRRAWLILPLTVAMFGCTSSDLNSFLDEPDAASGGAGGSLMGGTGGTTAITASPDAGRGGAGGTPVGGAGGTLDSDAEPSASGGSAGADPCKGVPPEGVCISGSNSWQFCSVPTGDGQPELLQIDCATHEECVIGTYGADCMIKAGSCAKGASQCVGNQLRECPGSTWVTTDCVIACQDTALGGFCAGEVATDAYTGTIKYEARGVKADYSDWATSLSTVAAPSILLVSLRGTALVDAQLSDANGAFDLAIPAPFQTDDAIRALLLYPNADNTGFAFGVIDPDLADGTQAEGSDLGPNAHVWHWAIDPTTSPSGSTLLITEALGSGAVRVYDYLRYIYLSTWNQYAAPGPTLAVLLRMNTSWNCGACFLAKRPTSVSGLDFNSRIVIPATASDTSYWADPVTAHELGHWVMAAYGVSPGEGGGHDFTKPSFPGMAWSEGWATGFSSLMRDDSHYYDKQKGAMFWLDLQARSYSTGAWVRPTPAAGLLQKMDENEVAAMLWELGQSSQVGTDTVLATIQTPRMKKSPFARGYTRHQSVVVDGTLTTVDTGISAPMLADYLDALVCSGVPASVIDGVTDPTDYYPYPSSVPLCQ